jgi:hypothetical protein
MIRKETFTTYDKWTPPTLEEIKEMLFICAGSDKLEDLARILGLTPPTLRRWTRVGISYANWVLLSYIAGKGDILRPEHTEEDIEAKLQRLAGTSFIYHKKLNDLKEMKALSKKINKN